MSRQEIRVEVEDTGIARLTLARPDDRNAMTPAMGEEIKEAVAELNQRDDVRVVVISGEGRSFSAGGNLARLAEEAEAGSGGASEGKGIGGGRSFYSLFLSIRDLRAPSIAAINGHAIGAGFCFALGADLRVVHSKAKMGMTFVKLGIHPGMAATWNLPRLMAPSLAAELLYTGRLIDGEEAVRLGIASRVADDDFAEQVDALALEIAANAPVAVRAVKETLRGTMARSIEDAIGLEADQQAMTFGTEDAKEGIAAIQEKRAPNFVGR